MAEDQDLLDLIELGSATGGKARLSLDFSIVRDLTDEDIPALREHLPVGTTLQTLKSIRHSHHQLAQLLATGVSATEAGLIVGYSSAYISTLRGDPAFEELIRHYATQRELKFVEMLDRMRGLGFRFLEELEDRLESEPDKWSRREIMEAIELLAIKPQVAMRGMGGNGGPAAVQVNLSFVQAEGAPVPSQVAAVDLEFEDLDS